MITARRIYVQRGRIPGANNDVAVDLAVQPGHWAIAQGDLYIETSEGWELALEGWKIIGHESPRNAPKNG